MLFSEHLGRLGHITLGETLSPDAALVKATLEKMVEVENDLTAWYADVLQALSLGVARCDLIQRYNQHAIAAYEELNIVLAIISGLAPGVPETAPVPGLFAKNAQVVPASATTNRTIVLTQPGCLPSGLVDRTGLKVIPKGVCPTCPTPIGREEDIRPGGSLGNPVGAVAACLGAPVACGIIAAILLAGGYALIDKAGAHLSGAENQRLQAFVLSTATQAERARADIYLKCTTSAVAQLPEAKRTADAIDKIQARCGDMVAKIKVDDLVKATAPPPGIAGSIVQVVKWVGIAAVVALLAPPAVRAIGDAVARRRAAHA